MPDKEIIIPNLVAGKRYRMVIETPPTTDMPSLTAPSIEFVVPTAPRLLSTYRPSYFLGSEQYSYPITSYRTEAIPGTWVEVGGVSAAVAYATEIAGWIRTKNSYAYSFYVNQVTELAVGMDITVSGMSTAPDPTYYDYLIYRVDSFNADTRRSGGNYRVNCTARAGRALSGFTYNDGRALKSGDTSNNGWAYYTKSAIPAARYQNPSPGTHQVPYPDTAYATKYYVDVSAPEEISPTLADSNTVKDIPVFFYIKNGLYYDMNDVAFTNPLNGVLDPTTRLPKIISNSSWRNPVALTVRNNNAGSDASSTRDYRFTVVRYVLTGSNWYGSWLQTVDPSDPNPIFSNVISSQSAGRS